MTRRLPRSRRQLKQQLLAGVALVSAGLAGLSAASSGLLWAPEALKASSAPFRDLKEGSTLEEDVCGEMEDWELDGGVFVYLAALCYIFIALAIIADDYFVAALERISDALELSPDVAGATFMAAGSSSPELFVSLADNVFHKPAESLGAGTIVGSAIFNILIIISMSALLAKEVLVLDWRPILRDSLWYSWAIGTLIIVVWDGKIGIVESAIMVSSYVLYILYMTQNDKVVNMCCKRPENVEAQEGIDIGVQKHVPGDDTKLLKAQTASSTAKNYEGTAEGAAAATSSHGHAFLGEHERAASMLQAKYRVFQYHGHSPSQHVEGVTMDTETGHADLEKETPGSTTPSLSVEHGVIDASAPIPEEEVEDLGGYFDEVWDVPESILGKVWFVITRPIVVLARITIPDSKYPVFSGKFGIAGAFLISIAWIGVLSHYTVEFATKIGCIAGIPSALMGLTLIAVGMSIPDALSSILVARDGHGDMAVSNALGSNVFDILLGVGLPFLLSNLVYGEEVPVSRDDLDMSIFILFGVLLFVVALLILSKWRLYRGPAALMVLAYGAYVAVSYLHGLGKL